MLKEKTLPIFNLLIDPNLSVSNLPHFLFIHFYYSSIFNYLFSYEKTRLNKIQTLSQKVALIFNETWDEWCLSLYCLAQLQFSIGLAILLSYQYQNDMKE